MSEPGNDIYAPDLPTINRCVIATIPTTAFLKWAKEVPDGYPELELRDIWEEGMAYLISAGKGDPETCIHTNFAPIFDQELRYWLVDHALPPEDRSYEKFREFFDIRFCSMAMDLGQGTIKRNAE